MTSKDILKQRKIPIKPKTVQHIIKASKDGQYYCCKIRGGMCAAITRTPKGMKFHLTETHRVPEEKIKVKV